MNVLNAGRILFIRLATLTAGACLTTLALADPLPLENGDFSASGNNGSIGGGILGGSGSGVIGSGPWSGAYTGVVGLLAPAVLTIGNGRATISQIGVGAIGTANRGSFYQDTGVEVAQSQHYVLAADVQSTGVLTLSLLSGGNAGLSLTADSTLLSSTQTSADVGLSSARNGGVHIALGYDSTASDSGYLIASLYTNPTGVLLVDLLSTLSFDNVQITVAPMDALPAAMIGPGAGTPQAATVDTSFSTPLVVSVTDANGDPLQGVTVTFSAPSNGASASLSSLTAVTDVGGRAEVDAEANGTAGVYGVTATVPGMDNAATFALTNSGAGEPTITSIQGGNQGQAQTVTLGFECRLAVQVFDGADPAQGASVTFASPSTGASALLSDTMNVSTQLTETTDSQGIASVIATADTIPGSYTVTATLTSLSSGPLASTVPVGSYPMTNLDVSDRIFANGFEDEPALCGNFVN